MTFVKHQTDKKLDINLVQYKANRSASCELKYCTDLRNIATAIYLNSQAMIHTMDNIGYMYGAL